MGSHEDARVKKSAFFCVGLAAGLPASLLCLGLGIYIYRHEQRLLWLAVSVLAGVLALLSALSLIRFLRAAKPMSALARESLDAAPEAKELRDLAEIWLSALRQKESAESGGKNAGEDSHIQNEINALQNQMNPHFLYNTLDSIRGQAISIGAGEIAEMTEALSAFFRYSISQKGAIVTLRDELKNVDAYMQIQAFRFENRIKLKTELDLRCDPQELYVPKMILQPVVENCIVHGLEKKEGEGTVTVRVTQTERRLLINVSDDGQGMDCETLTRLNSSIRGEEEYNLSSARSSGIALRNVSRRIALHFGDQYGLIARSVVGVGTEISMNLPVVDINNVPPQYLKLTN